MKSRGIPFFPFMLIVLCASCEQKIPYIASISPRIGEMGDIITIRGEGFGDDRNESYVTIAGFAPTASSYIEWQDDRISLRTPEFGESGLVYVFRGNMKSNAALYSNHTAIPERVSGEEVGSSPRIISINPPSGAVGQMVTILGANFGSSREGSGVYFTWDAEPSPSTPAEEQTPSRVEVFETDFGYELWSEREIRLRVPDGAISGGVEVRTSRGKSRPEYFDVSGKPGTKTFKDKRSFAISYSVDIRVGDASSPNTLYLWIPQPVSSASQRKAELLSRTMDPFVENYRGTTLFRLKDMLPSSGAGITLSYIVEVYAVETDIRSSQIREDRSSPIKQIYTLATSLIPSDDPVIAGQAAAIVGREQNPYTKARLIYRWLLNEIAIQEEPLNGGVQEALLEKKADTYMAVLLFCALSRAAGVPTLPVSGVLVGPFPAARNHYWAEFWIEGLGWVPL
ncbi:MAG: IPT/TIG domain-containing protein, partial [Spirochaetaceae bacterium]|nr:IPT/TIG domain-containing protein [Spirochaetaceae bacterium]